MVFRSILRSVGFSYKLPGVNRSLSLDKDHLVNNGGKCTGPGVCIDKCPNGSLSLVRDEKKGVPMEVELLKN